MKQYKYNLQKEEIKIRKIINEIENPVDSMLNYFIYELNSTIKSKIPFSSENLIIFHTYKKYNLNDLKNHFPDSNTEYFDRNFNMLKEKFENKKSFTEISKINNLSSKRCTDIIKRLVRKFFIYSINYNNIIPELEKITKNGEWSLNEYKYYIQLIFINNNDSTNVRYLYHAGMLSTRAENSLHRAGIQDLKEIDGFKYSKILKTRNLGLNTLKEIDEICKKYNINLINDLIKLNNLDKEESEKVKRYKNKINKLKKENEELKNELNNIINKYNNLVNNIINDIYNNKESLISNTNLKYTYNDIFHDYKTANQFYFKKD